MAWKHDLRPCWACYPGAYKPTALGPPLISPTGKIHLDGEVIGETVCGHDATQVGWYWSNHAWGWLLNDVAKFHR